MIRPQCGAVFEGAAGICKSRTARLNVCRRHLRRPPEPGKLHTLFVARPCPPLTGDSSSPDPVNEMNSAAVLTFVLIAGIVWGGFLFILTTAVRKESRKADRS